MDRVLAAIDAAPVAYRAELGRDVLSWLNELTGTPADLKTKGRPDAR